jgi:glycogen(starch) synthase
MKSLTRKQIAKTYLLEAAWEVVNPVGGIHTVIRTKVQEVQNTFGDRSLLAGPYVRRHAELEYEPEDGQTPFHLCALELEKEEGFRVHVGRWLVPGRPLVALFETDEKHLADAVEELEDIAGKQFPPIAELQRGVLLFGYALNRFCMRLPKFLPEGKSLIFHFHEWMAALPLVFHPFPGPNTATVFTTHATLLGRYLSGLDRNLYDHLSYFNPEAEARNFGIELPFFLEKAAAQNAVVLSTVSPLTGEECEYLLQRPSDCFLPNGIGIHRFTALHEFQNLHQRFKQRIHRFTMGHFFHNQVFDLDKTLYFFTSGRFEFQNKGFDLVLEAMGKLNNLMKSTGSDKTVVLFLISNRPVKSINPEVMGWRAGLEEVHRSLESILDNLGENLLEKTITGGKLPELEGLIDEEKLLRLRRNIHAYKSQVMPTIVTHNLVEDHQDPVLTFLRDRFLLNFKEDPVKIVYHPQFIDANNPLFGLEYDEFVRGCHLGIFPSSYEPWGYTPLECVARGVPTVTSDLSGFGQWVGENLGDNPEDHEEKGITVLKRRGKPLEDSARDLAQKLLNFAEMDRRERIKQRNRTEAMSVNFDWSKLYLYYLAAYRKALFDTP